MKQMLLALEEGTHSNPDPDPDQAAKGHSVTHVHEMHPDAESGAIQV